MKKGDFALDLASKVVDGFLAGLLISLGGAVFLACNNPQTPYARYIGAFLFSLALLCICMRGYALYTGKIGLITEKHSRDDILLLVLCLVGNVLATVAFGYLLGWIFPYESHRAYALQRQTCAGLSFRPFTRLFLRNFGLSVR